MRRVVQGKDGPSFPQKKILRADGSKDCTQFRLVLAMGTYRHTPVPRFPSIRQVFWLTDRPNACTFPAKLHRQWFCRKRRPRSQRRDRSRFSRDSLLSAEHLIAQ